MAEKKINKKSLLLRLLKVGVFSLCALFVLALTFLVYYFSVTSQTTLNASALTSVGQSSINIVSADLKPISTKLGNGNSVVKLKDLPPFTPLAFISMEDKAFYSHNGINPKRMVGAMLTNLKAGKAKQGASTITQQLVKNSFLSSEKTLDRKLKEIKLAFEVEKKFTKDEIIEAYLNTIYFGNGVYGIEDASLFYFDKHASNLNLNESAMLAAIINAPALYNPISHYDAAVSRKNLVLKNMLDDGFISNEEYNEAINNSVVISAKNKANAYSMEVIKEACLVLGEDENTIASKNLTIVTYFDETLQNKINELLNSSVYCPKEDNVSPNAISIVIDNSSGAVISFATNMREIPEEFKREPGSVIKPIIVYAPALEKNIINPLTQILDEPINYGGYSPSNADDTYHGFVSTREALKKSLNVPAVKILNMVTVDYAKNFAAKLGVNLTNQDNNLAIALGGLTEGLSPKEVIDAYLCFARGGNYQESKFIKEIRAKDGTVIYSNNTSPNRVMDEANAYLLTDMLKSVTKGGTGIRLSDLNFEIASKTGTAGLNNSSRNSDAWSVCFTTEHTILTWIGAPNSNGLDPKINGSTYPTIINHKILEQLYNEHRPNNFSQPQSVVRLNVEAASLINDHVVRLAPSEILNSGDLSELFNINNLPNG